MSRSSVINQVLPYLTRRPGEIVYVDEIVKDTGLDRRQVANSIAAARRSNDTLTSEIQVVIAANAWRYVPFVKPTHSAQSNGIVPATETATPRVDPRPTAGRRSDKLTDPVAAARKTVCVFEEIGRTAEGLLIIQDETGKLYRAEEL